MWFTELAGNRIGRITPDGVVTEFSAGAPTNGALTNSITSITAGPDGNLWFTRSYPRTVGRITTGGSIAEFTSGYDASPSAITAGPDGNLWFVDGSGLGQVGRITPDGNVTKFKSNLIGFGAGWSGLSDITTGPDGNLWFTYSSENKIGRVTTSGEFTVFTAGITGDSFPLRIVSGSDGNLWFIQFNSGQVGRITPSGLVTEFSTRFDPLDSNRTLAAGKDGNIWSVDDTGRRVIRITPSGAITEFWTNHYGFAHGLVVDRDGSLWWTDSVNNAIIKFTPGLTPALSVSLAGAGAGSVMSANVRGISCPGTCSAEFQLNGYISLKATPADGSSFAGWGGACSGTGDCTVAMSAAQTVTANFFSSTPVVPTPTLTPTCTLIANPSSVSAGNTVTLTASCSNSPKSYSWTGGTCAGTTASTCTATPKATTTYTITATNSEGTGAAAYATVVVKDPTPSTKRYTDNGDGTVTDSSTGLTWMRCAVGQSWTGSTCSGTATTLTLKNVSASPFAGRTDWRLPNIRELQTIVDRFRVNPAIDTAAFPNTPITEFWSSTATPESLYLDPGNAWSVTSYHGTTATPFQNTLLAVRFVSGGQSASSLLSTARSTSDYVDQGDGTVTHIPTGLMWKRCAEGQTWSGSTCTGTASTWTAAQAALHGRTYAGHTDWRLPTQDELVSLVDYSSASKPKLNGTTFPATPSWYFWSSSPYAGNGQFSWSVNFDSGDSVYQDRSNGTFNVRLVRSAPQSLGSYSLSVSKTGTGTGAIASTSPGISCGTTCSASFASGTSVTLTATPDSGSTFTGWGGACTGTGNCVVALGSSQSVTATFTANTCSYALGNNTMAVGASGSSGTINVTAISAACVGWAATSNASWITISTIAASTVSGSVAYTVAANTSSTSRTGTLTIAGKTLTIVQAGQPVLACTLSANPSSIPAGGSSTLTASCTGATTYVWSDGGCSSTSLTCTVSPTVTTQYTVVGTNNSAVADASQTVTVAARPVVGNYEGIYQWFDANPVDPTSIKTYLSLHQDGSNMIATLYFNTSSTPSLPFMPTSGGTLPVAFLDAFDLLSGSITGATAKLTGTRVFRSCNVSYDFTFGDSGQLTATRTGVSNTSAANLSGIDCAKNLSTESATLTMRKIPFGVASPAPVAGPVDGIYLWSADNYFSLHQVGADLIATNYFNENYPIAGGPQLNSYDLLGGSFKGATAQISGTRYHRACNVTYSLTVNADGSLTATRNSVTNTAAANAAGINCQAIVEAESSGATLTVRKLSFK
jgi:sugar lactone lactonase YvrE